MCFRSATYYAVFVWIIVPLDVNSPADTKRDVRCLQIILIFLSLSLISVLNNVRVFFLSVTSIFQLQRV